MKRPTTIATLLALLLFTAQMAKAQTVDITTSAELSSTAGYFTTVSSSQPLDFTGMSDVKAYTVKVETKNNLTYLIFGIILKEITGLKLTQVTRVPANTGIVVKTTKPGTVSVPVATGTVSALANNDLVAATTRIDAGEYAITNERMPYTLQCHHDQLGFYPNFTLDHQEPLTGVDFIEAGSAFLSIDPNSSLIVENGDGFIPVITGDEVVVPEAVTTSATLTDGTAYYATYSSSHALDFSQTGGEAFIVEPVKNSQDIVVKVSLLPVSRVPAKTGIVVRTSLPTTVYPKVIDGEKTDNVSANQLQAVITGRDAAKTYTGLEVPYTLCMTDGNIGFRCELRFDRNLDAYPDEVWLPAKSAYLVMAGSDHIGIEDNSISYLWTNTDIPTPPDSTPDINHDGAVDVGDIMVIINQMASGGASSATADVNHDGTVDVGDIMAIINYMAANGN